MDNRTEIAPGMVFTAPITGDASFARIRSEIDELRQNNQVQRDVLAEQAHTLHQLRAAVEPFADNLREMLERLAEALGDGHLEYGTGYLEGSSPCIRSKLDELLGILQIDPVGEDDDD